MTTSRVKLSVFAKNQGITYTTAYRAWNNGHLDGIKLPSGTILVSGWMEDKTKTTEKVKVIIYSRVSDPRNISGLREQTKRMKKHVEETEKYVLLDTVEEVGTGFNDHRTKLLTLIYRTDWDILIIDNRDQLSIFSYPYIEAALRKNNQEIVSLSDAISHNDSTEPTMTASGESQLISLISRVRSTMKTMIGVGGKTQIESTIQSILK